MLWGKGIASSHRLVTSKCSFLEHMPSPQDHRLGQQEIFDDRGGLDGGTGRVLLYTCMVYPYSGLVLGKKKGRATDTCNNVNEP